MCLSREITPIKNLVKNLKDKKNEQVLLGVTGSGKTFTMAKVIENTNRPALILAPNKTLAAQLYGEFKSFFPDNNFIFVENQKNKIITDFYLLKQCKNFIVGPTSFHWWGAWLSKYEDKICIYPKNINPSNNIDFWPNSWFAV